MFDKILEELFKPEVLIPTTVSVVGFLCILAVGFWARSITRKKATMDLVIEAHFDHDYLERALLANQFTITGVDVEALIKRRASEESTDEKIIKKDNALLYILNYWEFIAIGINNNVYNEKILKEAHKTSVIDLGHVTRGLLKELRLSYPNVFIEFTKLHNKWSCNHWFAFGKKKNK